MVALHYRDTSISIRVGIHPFGKRYVLYITDKQVIEKNMLNNLIFRKPMNIFTP